MIDATFRVLPVQDGRQNPVTELLLHGAFGTEAACRMHPVTWLRRIVEVVGQRLTPTTGGAMEHWRPRAPDVCFGAELSHAGG